MKSFKTMGAIKQVAQKGFTIIELVVVILLLGILTATALPRFLDVTSEAHEAAVGGVAGGLRTGVAMYKANWFALNQPTDDAGLSDWANLVANSSGYPTGTSVGGSTVGVVDASTKCRAIANVLQDGDSQIGDISTMTSAAISDTATGDPSAANLELAANYTTADYDWTAALFDSNVCKFWYLNDPTRLDPTTTPFLQYNASTGAITRGNVPAN